MGINRSKKETGQRKLGLERIERLFELAGEAFEKHPERAHRNVRLARKIAMRYNIRMPKKYRIRFCSKCYKYLPPNITHDKLKGKDMIVIRCVECGFVNRISGVKGAGKK